VRGQDQAHRIDRRGGWPGRQFPYPSWFQSLLNFDGEDPRSLVRSRDPKDRVLPLRTLLGASVEHYAPASGKPALELSESFPEQNVV
jgi:hypothetical protein